MTVGFHILRIVFTKLKPSQLGKQKVVIENKIENLLIILAIFVVPN